MTLLDEVRRFLAEDTRRRVTDPKPLYATAGALDVAVDFLRGVPQRLETAADRARVEWTPERFGDAFTDLVEDTRESADDVVRRLQEQRSRISSPADLASSAREAAEEVLEEARKAPGRVAVSVAETAGAVFETYDDLAERGKTVLARLRGDAAPGETATSGGPTHAPPVFRRPTSPTAPPPPAGPPGDPATAHAAPPAPPASPARFTRPAAPDPVSPDPISADPISADPIPADPIPADPISAPGPAAGVGPVGHDVSGPLPSPTEHPTPADLTPANAGPVTGSPTARTTSARNPSARKMTARTPTAGTTTAGGTTARKTTAPGTTARQTTAPGTTARKSTAPGTTARVTSAGELGGVTPVGKRSPTKKAPAGRTAAGGAAVEPSVQGNAVTTRRVTSRASTPAAASSAPADASDPLGDEAATPPANAARRAPRRAAPSPDPDSTD